eukprot:CAMPEP_0115167216 /NCGR_PEP_ID=MMETSP0270-20121206/97_1 /TAXON_ID=71861 /ORGANISM="Scrippsiella trochoidea, Strain CCMP3099" /LENGTH=189 /DNA_ID=CAMNT_0002579793 /DNA_START=34 /DNA_END=602 /DNA_ORIENTATION=-
MAKFKLSMQRSHAQSVAEISQAFVSAPYRPQQMVLRAADRPARVRMHQKVQIAPVRHHPWDGIGVSVHRHKDGKIWSDEWGSIRNGRSRSIHRKCTERCLVENVSLTLGNIEMLDEGRAKGPRELGAVRVLVQVPNYIWIEKDVDVDDSKGFAPGSHVQPTSLLAGSECASTNARTAKKSSEAESLNEI